MPWVLIKFLHLEGRCLIEAWHLLNFYHFDKMVSVIATKQYLRPNGKDVPKQNLTMTLELKLGRCLCEAGWLTK